MSSEFNFKLVCDSCGKPIGNIICNYHIPHNCEAVRMIEVRREGLLLRVLCDKCLSKKFEEDNNES